MANTYSPPSLLSPNQPGVCVAEDDFNGLAPYINAIAGYAIAFSQGLSAGNAIPQFQFINVQPGTGLQIIVGSNSTPQWALITGLMSATTSKQNFSVPSNSSGQTRIDAVCIQSQYQSSGNVTRNVMGPGGGVTPQAIPENYLGVNLQYVTGTPGAGAPSAPSGFQIYALITVPNGASNITTGDIVIQFPTMNPQGPAGPAGPGTTTLTANVVIPPQGSAVNAQVADVVGFPIGTTGMMLSGDASCGMYYRVTNVSGSVLTVLNIGTVVGYSNTGTMTSGGPVGFGNEQPTRTTAALSGGMPNIGDTVNIPVNGIGEWQTGEGGLFIGSDGTHGWSFVVTAIPDDIHLTVVCAATIWGQVGSGCAEFSFLYPLARVDVDFADGQLLGYGGGGAFPSSTPIKYTFRGTVNIATNGGTQTVTLPTLDGSTPIFSSANDYEIVGLVPIPATGHAFVPCITAKTATTFDITITNDLPGHGQVTWKVEGFVVP